MCDQCYNTCPNCRPDLYPEPELCPLCDGTGKEYYCLDDDAETGERMVTREEYEALPPGLREQRKCHICNGEGCIT